jgi:hypothetical protein
VIFRDDEPKSPSASLSYEDLMKLTWRKRGKTEEEIPFLWQEYQKRNNRG